MENFCHWLIRPPQGGGADSESSGWGGDTALSGSLRRGLINLDWGSDYIDDAVEQMLRSMSLHPEGLFPQPVPGLPIDAEHQPDYAAVLGYLRTIVDSVDSREWNSNHPLAGEFETPVSTGGALVRHGLDDESRRQAIRPALASLDWSPNVDGTPGFEPAAPPLILDGDRAERAADLLIAMAAARAKALERVAARLLTGPDCVDAADRRAAVARVRAYAGQGREVVEREYGQGRRTELPHGVLAAINEVWAADHPGTGGRNRARDFEPRFVFAVWRAIEELALGRTCAMVGRALEDANPRSAVLARSAARVRAPLDYLTRYHARTMEYRVSRGREALAAIVPTPAQPDPLVSIAETRRLVWHALLLESGYPRTAKLLVPPFPVWPGGSEASRRLIEGGAEL